MIPGTILFDISIVIVAATVLAYLAHILKQPLIPGYIIAGLLIGPVGIGLVTNSEVISTFSELGIALLLFIVGMELTFSRLKSVGSKSAIIGIAEVLIMTLLGYIVALALGFTPIASIYIGLVLAFSSTMVVIKMLADRKKLDTLHARLMLGILLTQDIIVILVLPVLIEFNNLSLTVLPLAVLSGLGMFTIAIVASKYIVSRVLHYISDSTELLFLFSLAWLFFFAAIAYYNGFSVAIGAFIAGVGLAATSYNVEIVSRMRSLRDFFVTIFFVSLGMAIVPITQAFIYPVIIFLLMTVFLKPLIIIALSSAMKYGARTSFLTARGLGQTSEFSLIIIASGLALSHISEELFSAIILVTVITISLTTYFIKYERQMYNGLKPVLRFLKRDSTHESENLVNLPKEDTDGHIVILGGSRMGSEIIRTLMEMDKKFLVIDFDPDVIRRLIDKDVSCLYGDVGDIEILNRVNLKDAKIVISTVPDREDSLLVLNKMQEMGSDASVIVVASTVEDALEMYEKGASYVVIPRVLSGDEVAHVLKEYDTKSKIKKLRERHIRLLNKEEEEDIIIKYEPDFLKKLHEEEKIE